MISEQKQIIEDIVANLHDVYLKPRVNPYKIMQDILTIEKIKYREIESDNEKFCGMYTKSPNGTSYIFINKKTKNIGRQNFSFAHEIGHHFLKHKLKGFCNIIDGEEAVAKSPECKQADYFAGCFLMPTEKIASAFKGILTNSRKIKSSDFLIVNNSTYGVWCGIAENLTGRYGVTVEALKVRLSQLNLIHWAM